MNTYKIEFILQNGNTHETFMQSKLDENYEIDKIVEIAEGLFDENVTEWIAVNVYRIVKKEG